MKQATLPYVLKKKGGEVPESILKETEEYVQPPIKTKYKIVTTGLEDHYSLDFFLKVGNVNFKGLERKRKTLESRIEANRSYLDELRQIEGVEHFMEKNKDLIRELENKNSNGYSLKFNKKFGLAFDNFIENVECSYNQEKLRKRLKDLFKTKKELKKLERRKEKRKDLYMEKIIESPKRIKLERTGEEEIEEIEGIDERKGTFKVFSKAYKALKEVLGKN